MAHWRDLKSCDGCIVAGFVFCTEGKSINGTSNVCVDESRENTFTGNCDDYRNEYRDVQLYPRKDRLDCFFDNQQGILSVGGIIGGLILLGCSCFAFMLWKNPDQRHEAASKIKEKKDRDVARMKASRLGQHAMADFEKMKDSRLGQFTSTKLHEIKDHHERNRVQKMSHQQREEYNKLHWEREQIEIQMQQLRHGLGGGSVGSV